MNYFEKKEKTINAFELNKTELLKLINDTLNIGAQLPSFFLKDLNGYKTELANDYILLDIELYELPESYKLSQPKDNSVKRNIFQFRLKILFANQISYRTLYQLELFRYDNDAWAKSFYKYNEFKTNDFYQKSELLTSFETSKDKIADFIIQSIIN